MKNLAQILVFGCLFLTFNGFSQKSNVDLGNIIPEIIQRSYVISSTIETTESIEKNNYLQTEKIINQSLIIGNVDVDVENEYDYEYEVPKKQLSNNLNIPEIEYEEEYEYEIVDTQFGNIASGSHEEYEYEYDAPNNQSISFGNDPQAEYEYE